MHPFGIGNQNGKLTLPLPYFSGRVDGIGKVDIKPLAFLDALAHDGFHKSFGRAMIQQIGRRGFCQLHINLNAVALMGTDAGHILGKLLPLFIIGGHDFAKLFHGKAVVGHKVAHFAPTMFVEGV